MATFVPSLTSLVGLFQAPHMAFCDRCDRSFTDARALKQHVADSSDHHVCSECHKDLSSAHGMLQHTEQKHGPFVCDECPDRDFVSAAALRQHCAATGHRRRSANLSPSPSYDDDEDDDDSGSDASDSEALEDWQAPAGCRRPSVHQPECYVCPVARCERRFASGGALVQHLEGGTCADAYGSTAGVHVPISLVSVPVRVPQQHANNNMSVIAVVSTHLVTGRRDTSGIKPPVAGRKIVKFSNEGDIATEDSWNGSRYECVLCHKTFQSLPQLNNHLRSAERGAHRTKRFRCKHANGSRACGKKFSELKELVMHAEEAACGVKRFMKEME